MGTFKLLCRDVIEALRPLPPNLFHGALCDPPYGLSKNGSTGGFMGKRWDAKVPGVEYWSEVLRVLKPGASILAFGGTRTYHRLACAIEDAGFEIFDSILGATWIYGQGFPKSLDIGKAIDKLDAVEARRARDLRCTQWMRETGLTATRIDQITGTNMGGHYLTAASQPAVPTRELFEKLRPFISCSVPAWLETLIDERTIESENLKRRELLATQVRYNEPSGIVNAGRGAEARTLVERRITAPHTNAACAWDGYGTALKPAWEPVVFARKPLSGTYAENCIEHGCGGLNIDGSRIGTDPSGWGGKAAGGGTWNASNCGLAKDGTPTNSVGRYPANLVLSHHPDCNPLGTRRVPPRGGDIKANSKGAGPRSNQVYGQDAADRGEWTAYKGEDGLEEIEAWECHPECPVAALDRQSGPSSSRKGTPRKGKSGDGWGMTHTGAEYEDRGGASRFFASFDFRYAPKVSTAERNAGGVTNRHSTLKPLTLTTYLAQLILPPPHISSRLLVPFCGTGSEIAGALLAGWDHVVGIDNDPESISTAQDRIPGLIARGTK